MNALMVGFPPRSICVSVPSRRRLIEAQIPICGSAPSMSSGTSSAIDRAPGWKSRLVMTAGGNSMGGLTVGFESMISTVLPGSSVDLNAYTSVRSSRVSSLGNLR